MDDDEQHFVVLVRERMLRIEQLVEVAGTASSSVTSRRSQWTSSSLKSTNGLTRGGVSFMSVLEHPGRYGAPAGEQLPVEAPVIGLE